MTGTITPGGSPPGTYSAEAIDQNLKRRIKAVQLGLLQGKARAANSAAEVAELQAMQAKRAESHFKVTDDMVHKFYFVGAVDGQNVNMASQHLAFWHRLDPTCPMDIEIHSLGGSALAGINLFDQLTAYSLQGGGQHKVTITVRGVAASMATVLVQAADERIIGPESFFMVHELSGQTAGKIGELEDTMKFYRKLNGRIADIYVRRAGGKCSRPDFDALWNRQDVWLDSQETLDLGFVDRIG